MARGDCGAKASPVKKACGADKGGVRVKDRKTSKDWVTYCDDEKKGHE